MQLRATPTMLALIFVSAATGLVAPPGRALRAELFAVAVFVLLAVSASFTAGVRRMRGEAATLPSG
jgi:hypothetical protein